MSVRVMTLVWAIDLPDSEKIVLLALADSANDEGHCWPGMKSLVRKCSKSDRTVQTAIQSLCDKGHLTRREVPGKGCNYTVHPKPTPEAVSPPKGVRETPEAVSGKPSMNHSVAKATGVPPDDPAKQLFDLGVSLLTGGGKSEKEARSLIGKWRKTNGDAAVLAALIDCRAKGITDPVEWMQKSLGGQSGYVSASGYRYRGDADAVMREAERRADWATYYAVKGKQAA